MLSRGLRHSRSAPTLRAGRSSLHSSSPLPKPSPIVLRQIPAGVTPTTPLSAAKNKTVVQLKSELKTRGLSTSGNKADLVKRLTQFNSSSVPATPIFNTPPSSPSKAIKSKGSMPSLRNTSTMASPKRTIHPPLPSGTSEMMSSLRSNKASPIKASPQQKRLASTVDDIRMPTPPPLPKVVQQRPYDYIPTLHDMHKAPTPKKIPEPSAGPKVNIVSHATHHGTPTAVAPISESDVAHLHDTVHIPIKTSQIKNTVETGAAAQTLQSGFKSTMKRATEGWKSNTSKNAKFVPDTSEIPKQDKTILYALLGGGTLWGLFGK